MLRLGNPRPYIEGVLFAEGPVDARGICCFSLPPAVGRWLLTAPPGKHPGFQLAGRAAGKTIEFIHNGRAFRIECAGHVAAGGERPVNVHH